MLHFSPTTSTLWIGITALTVVIVLALLNVKRSARKSRTAWLESMRILATLLVVLMLWQPEWRTIVNPESRPTIAILWDASRSMETLDVVSSDDGKVQSRSDWVRKSLGSDIWSSLEASGANDLLIQPFAEPSENGISGTDLEAPLSKLLENRDNLRAVVLLSDGEANLGQPPVVAAQKLHLRGVPVFPVPVGSPSRLPDLDLISVTAPSYGIVGENVQIPFTIRSSLDRPVRTLVRLRDETGREETRDIVLPPNTETYESVLWRIEKEGAVKLELSIPVTEGELIAENNKRAFVMSGKPERIRVLVIESLPRWEYRFLRNALSRDPGVELSCLLFHPDLGMGGGRDYLDAFPEKPEDLARYDVIFLGDVGIKDGQLTNAQCELIKDLVEDQASGLVFLPGPQGNQATLSDSPLSDLLPVVPDSLSPEGLAETIPAPLNLTSEGRSSLLTLLGKDEEENPEIWRRLPGFYWHAAVTRAKAGTEVLAVHGNRRGKFGPIPIIVTKTSGSGKVLFMGIDSAWRWRRGVEDLYHYRFWGQVARWMSYQRNMAAGQRVRLFFTPERPEPGSTVTIHANAFDANGAPQQSGSVRLNITSPNGEIERLELQKTEGSWGAFSGRVKIDLPGSWKLQAASSEAPKEILETTLLAQGTELEKIGQPARPEVLEEIAKVTRGRLVQPHQITELAREITALPEPKPLESRIPLWSHWAVLTTLVLLLGLFWTARKLTGVF